MLNLRIHLNQEFHETLGLLSVLLSFVYSIDISSICLQAKYFDDSIYPFISDCTQSLDLWYTSIFFCLDFSSTLISGLFNSHRYLGCNCCPKIIEITFMLLQLYSILVDHFQQLITLLFIFFLEFAIYFSHIVLRSFLN